MTTPQAEAEKKEKEAGEALLASAEKMICAVEAHPALLYGAFGNFLRVLLDEIRSLFGPSDFLDSLQARVRSVRSQHPAPLLGVFSVADYRKRKGPK